MSGLFLPISLFFAALIAAIATYRGIRRGGARFYTLEREALLRRAGFTLFSAVVLFSAAIGILIFERQQMLAVEQPAEGDVVEEGDTTILTTPEVNSLPPLPTETSTPDVTIPTATPTTVICRGIVEGTFDNGLTLRDAPGGAEVDVLAEASIVTVILEEEPVEANGFVWLKVRSLFGDEGWVAANFLTLGGGCE